VAGIKELDRKLSCEINDDQNIDRTTTMSEGIQQQQQQHTAKKWRSACRNIVVVRNNAHGGGVLWSASVTTDHRTAFDV